MTSPVYPATPLIRLPGDVEVQLTALVMTQAGGHSVSSFRVFVHPSTPDGSAPDVGQFHVEVLSVPTPGSPDSAVQAQVSAVLDPENYSWIPGPRPLWMEAYLELDTEGGPPVEATHLGVYLLERTPPGITGVPAGPPTIHGAGSRPLRRSSAPDGSRISALRELAGTTGSLVYHTRDGVLVYETPDYRAGLATATPTLTLVDSDILDSVSWTSRLDDLVTEATVVYGDGERDDERPRTSARAPLADTLYRPVTIDSPLLSQTDAEALASRTVGRWSTPSWTAPQIITRDDLLDDTTYQALLDLDVSSVIDTSGVTAQPDLTGGTGRWVVEGWEETWDRPGAGAPLVHQVQLAVTEVSRWT